MVAHEVLVFMLSLAYFIHTSAGGTYVVTPSNTESARAATTRFLCTVVLSIGSDEEVYWHFEPSGSNIQDVATIGPFTNRNPTAFPRYMITGDYSAGIYNLEISDTQMADQGTYSCLIVKGSMTMMSEAQLTIRENTAPPIATATCDNGNLMSAHNEGEVVTISCMITGGVPLPILQIVRNRETSSSHEVVPSSTSLNGDVVTETATFAMSPVDHNARFHCITLYPDKTEYEMGTFSCDFSPSNIQISFAPVVSIYPSQLLIDGNDDNQVITLTCDVNANPQGGPVTWDYQTNKLPTAEVNGAELKFTGVRESYIGETITCNAENSIGSGSGNITIEKSDTLLPFETYILFIIIAGGCLLFFIFVCLIIVCCCQKDDASDENEKNLGYQVNDSRPTSMHQQGMTNNDEIIDGFDSDNFSGGSEANLVRDESHKSRASARSTGTDRADNRSSVRSNDYNDVNTFENSAYSPDEDGLNDTPLY